MTTADPPPTNDPGSPASEPTPAARRGPWRRRLLRWLVSIVVLWLLGDWLYSRVILWRMARWERTIRRHPDGVLEGCEDFAVGPDDPAAPALLMVHGINDSPACFRAMAARLAERGVYCRAPRLPGFALPTEQYAQHGREEWLRAVRDELVELRRTHRQVGLAAHSLGGAIAIRLLLDELDDDTARTAADRPPLVDRLVLLAPAVEVSAARSPVLSPATWHRVSNRLLLFTRVTESPFTLDAVEVDEQDYPFRTPFTPRRVFDETFALIEANRGDAHRLRVPLLLVVSREDHVIDWHAAERFYNEYGADDSRKQIYYADPAGHSLTIDIGWQPMTDAVAEFLLKSPE